MVERAFGRADIAGGVVNAPSTRFKLMSVTKSITAVALLRLVQSKKLTIDDPVSKHLPAWPAGWEDVLIRHLLDHTSGLPNLETSWVVEARKGADRGLGVWRRLAPQLARPALEAPAGSRHRYSNFNYVLLGAVAEAVTGLEYPEIVRVEVFEPAGMKASGFDDGNLRPGLALGYFRGKGGVPDPRRQDMSTILAAGGIYSTAADLYRFDRALASGKLLSAALRQRMQTPAPNTYGYALGWQVRPIHGHACARHSGGANGYVADLLRFIEDDACVVLLSNFAYAPSVLLAEGLAGCLLERDVDMPARVPSKVLDRYLGAYRGPSSTAVVRRSGDCLAMYEQKDGESRVTPTLLVALGEDRFRRQAWPTLLHFTIGKQGPTQLVMEGTRPTTFSTLRVDAKAWKKAVGRYRDAKGSAKYRIMRLKGALQLRLPEGWGGVDLTLLPVAADRALTLFYEDFATVLTLDRDEKGTVSGFRWMRNDGQVVVCTRSGR